MKKRLVVGALVIFVLITLVQVSPAGAWFNQYARIKGLDCEQVCVGVVVPAGETFSATVVLSVDGQVVLQLDNLTIQGGEYGWAWVPPCLTWADDGDPLTFDLGYDVHTVRFEAVGYDDQELPIGPCAELPPGGQGCTPGYWKNHEEAWAATGYAPTDDLDATFSVDLFDPNITLLEAVNARGGGNNRLARHGTAALLSAAHPGVGYPYSPEEVIAFVQMGNADVLEQANELFCPLD